uniref:PGG domain-containing protein n=1 Tax=Aegilops tauschii TaxID=37682 RepID=M8C1K8_AEGTA
MTQENQHAVVVLPVANATEGGLVDSAGRPKESQHARLKIDIGENRSMVIEITLTGKLALQCPADAAPSAGAAAPAAAAAEGKMAAPDNISKKQAVHALKYVLINTTTFAISLALVLALVIMKRSPPTRFIYMVKVMVGLLCFFVAWTFAIGNAYDPAASWLVVAYLALYGFYTLVTFFAVMWLPYHLLRPALERLKLLPKPAAQMKVPCFHVELAAISSGRIKLRRD